MPTDKIKCPECGKERELQPKEGNPLRMVALCDCNNRGMRPVYETDAPGASTNVSPETEDSGDWKRSKR